MAYQSASCRRINRYSLSHRPFTWTRLMTNGNWICLDCRTSVRRPTWRMIIYFRPWLFGSTGVGNVKCPNCKRLCRFIGPDTKVPPKRDDSGWAQLRATVRESRMLTSDAQRVTGTRRKHEIEQRIIQLESRPASAERNRLVKQLRDELDDLATSQS